jgi:hypothetical protein
MAKKKAGKKAGGKKSISRGPGGPPPSGGVSGVAKSRVGAVVQDFVNAGATVVRCRQDADGTWTVTAS